MSKKKKIIGICFIIIAMVISLFLIIKTNAALDRTAKNVVQDEKSLVRTAAWLSRRAASNSKVNATTLSSRLEVYGYTGKTTVTTESETTILVTFNETGNVYRIDIDSGLVRSTDEYFLTVDNSMLSGATVEVKVTDDDDAVTSARVSSNTGNQTVIYTARSTVEISLVASADTDFATGTLLQYCKIDGSKIASGAQNIVNIPRKALNTNADITITPVVTFEKCYLYRVGYGLNTNVVSSISKNAYSPLNKNISPNVFNITTTNIDMQLGGENSRMDCTFNFVQDVMSSYKNITMVSFGGTAQVGGSGWGATGSSSSINLVRGTTYTIYLGGSSSSSSSRKTVTIEGGTYTSAIEGISGDLIIKGIANGTSNNVYADIKITIGDIYLSTPIAPATSSDLIDGEGDYIMTVDNSMLDGGGIIAKVTNSDGLITTVTVDSSTGDKEIAFNTDSVLEITTASSVTDTNFHTSGSVRYCIIDGSTVVNASNNKVTISTGVLDQGSNVTITPVVAYEKLYLYRVGYGLNPDLVGSVTTNFSGMNEHKIDSAYQKFGISNTKIDAQLGGESATGLATFNLLQDISMYKTISVTSLGGTALVGGHHSSTGDSDPACDGSSAWIDILKGGTTVIGSLVGASNSGSSENTVTLSTKTSTGTIKDIEGNICIRTRANGTNNNVYARIICGLGDIYLTYN